MLAANEAVAEHFTRLEVPFLRRVHPAPNEEKLEAFAQFAELLGYPIRRPQDRFELQRVLRRNRRQARARRGPLRSAAQPEAGHLLADPGRALRAGDQNYCHFTSPIRRYPDLQVHRLLDRWIKHGTASAERGGTDRARRPLLEDGTPRRDGRARTGEVEDPHLPEQPARRAARRGHHRRRGLRLLRAGRAVPGRGARSHLVARGRLLLVSTKSVTRWKGSAPSGASGSAIACGSRSRAWTCSGACSTCGSRRCTSERAMGESDKPPSYGKFPKRVRKNGRRRK